MRGDSKKKPKAEESALSKGPTPWATGMALWEGSFPHSRRLKLGMPTALPSGQDSGNVLEQRVEKIYIWLLQEVVAEVNKLALSAC